MTKRNCLVHEQGIVDSKKYYVMSTRPKKLTDDRRRAKRFTMDEAQRYIDKNYEFPELVVGTIEEA